MLYSKFENLANYDSSLFEKKKKTDVDLDHISISKVRFECFQFQVMFPVFRNSCCTFPISLFKAVSAGFVLFCASCLK